MLYSIIYSKDPNKDVRHVIESLKRDHSAQLRFEIISDIRRELGEPKQRMRHVLDLMAPEEREFLGLLADGLRG